MNVQKLLRQHEERKQKIVEARRELNEAQGPANLLLFCGQILNLASGVVADYGNIIAELSVRQFAAR